MATDASGWANSYSQTNPWHDALLANLSKSGQTGTPDPLANDPLTSSTTTSAARMLGSATPAAQQGGTLAQSLTGGSSASSAGAYPTFNTMMRSAAPPTYTVSQGRPLTAQPVANPNAGYALSGAGPGALAPAATSVGGVAPNAKGPTDYSHVGSWNNTYAGPSIVSVRTNNGNYAYYQFDAAKGSYTYVNTYGENGNLVQTSLDNLRSQFGTGPVTGYGPGQLTADQRANAQQTSLGGGVQVSDVAAGTDSILNNLNQANSASVDAYRNAYGTQATNAGAAAAQAQTQSDSAYILNYMVQNGGALPPVYKPGMSGVPMSQAAFDAAAAEYKANNSASFLNGTSLKSPDTSAVDQNGLAALLSLNSQYQTGANGADAAAQQAVGVSNATYQAGQNTLAHNADYADKFNANLGVYNDAVTKQGAADINATGQKLNQDIQAMSDMLQQLQQSAQQLGTQSQQAVTQQIQNLRNQINDYQVAAAQLGANNAHVAGIAQGILAAGGQLATAGIG